MKIKKNILNTIQGISSNALEFLNAKDKAIKNQAGILLKTEAGVVKNIGTGGMSESQQQAIQEMKGELHSVEFNEADIMKEQIIMNELSQDIQQILGNHTPSYGKAIKQLQSEKDKYSNYSGVLESKFNNIKGENSNKQSLREKIVFNDGKLDKAKEKYESFTLKFAPIYSSIQEREQGKNKKNIEKVDLEDRLSKLVSQTIELENQLSEEHIQAVDLSLVLKNAELEKEESDEVNSLYETNNLEELQDAYKNANGENDECKDELGELQTQVQVLKRDIAVKSREISTLNAEQDWLLTQNVAQGVEIDTLKAKLNLWESNYLIFKSLVKSLAEHVGYPITDPDAKLNANGDNDENPLIALIEQLRNITTWVEEQEDVFPDPTPDPITEVVEVEKEHSHIGYIIGGVVLAAAALMMKK